MRYRLILIAICAVAVIRVATTFHIFNATTDEPSHIANGYAWLTGAPYPRDLLHPPLAQVLAALPLVLQGAPKPLAEWDVVAGNELLYHDREYMRNVELARIGNLIFLIIGVIAVAAWGRRTFDPITGLVAAALWSLQPTLLAHCGVATTDATIIGLFPVAMLVLERFIELPTIRRAIELGAVCGLATLGKFSFIPFFIVAALVYAYRLRVKHIKGIALSAVALLLVLWAGYRFSFIPFFIVAALVYAYRLRVKHIKGIALSAVALLLVLWAGYRFSFGTILNSHPNAPTVIAEEMTKFEWVAKHVPLPAPQFFTGLGALKIHNRHGQLAYLFGQYNQFGFRSYFPVLLFYKTPLAFLLLFAWGVFCVIRARRGWIPLAVGLAILVSVLPTHINVGVRHVVPLYAAFAIVAAFGITTAWSETTLFARTALASLCLWFVLAGAFAHPDYLPYFNELARNPEQIATDSNLDWGQDWIRFIRWQNRTHPGKVAIVWYGSIDLSRHPVDGYGLQPYTKATGWIVASETGMKLASTNGHDFGEPYRWLEQYQPVMHIGKSLRVYRIDQ